MTDQDAVSVHKMECRDQNLERVVVYNDRAELKRLVLCDLNVGINEIRLENVTASIIHDSIRVDGRGHGVIHDVQLSEKAALREETDSPKTAELRGRHERKLQEVNALKDRITVLQKRIDALDKAVDCAGTTAVCPPKDQRETFILNKETLENLTDFYNFYDEAAMAVRSELRNVQATLKKNERELQVIQDELNRVECDQLRERYSKSFVITIESEKGGLAELEVSYQVHGASWRPSYDVRVDTTGKGSLKITYFGYISQTTAEDWFNASLVLSTAQPCLGGQIPELGVLEAIFYRPPPPSPPRAGDVVEGFALGRARMAKLSAAPLGAAETQSISFDADSTMEPAVACVAEPIKNALSTEFSIARPAAIPSDGAEHKVTIGIVDVTPKMIHECVPSKNLNAFLTSSAINSSSLPFLPGDAAIYLNNSFVAKTHLKNVSPGERFTCSLGVDTALRVEYKPVKKYHEQLGLINKSSSTVYEQVIVVKNSRPEPVLLVVKQQIPRSTDEKIKVRLIAPVVSHLDEQPCGEGDFTINTEHPKEGCVMRAGILEWTVAVQEGRNTELHVKYAVEHPRDEKVQFVERS